MKSETFRTLSEFNKQYNLIRNDILNRHGYKKGDRVRLKNAIMLYQNFNDQWLPITSVKTDMVNRIKMNEFLNNKNEFKLKALV